MEIKELNRRQNSFTDVKLNKIYTQFGELLNELRKRKLPENIVRLVNLSVDKINSSTLEDKQLTKLIRQEQKSILKQIEKEIRVVPKNYYLNLWMSLGMLIFGLPIGISIGLSLGNIGLLGIGFPIGMAFGLAVGSKLDKKALSEERQLNI